MLLQRVWYSVIDFSSACIRESTGDGDSSLNWGDTKGRFATGIVCSRAETDIKCFEAIPVTLKTEDLILKIC